MISDRGQGLVEYILIITLIALIAIAGVRMFGKKIYRLFQTIADVISGEQSYNSSTLNSYGGNTIRKYGLRDSFMLTGGEEIPTGIGSKITTVNPPSNNNFISNSYNTTNISDSKNYLLDSFIDWKGIETELNQNVNRTINEISGKISNTLLPDVHTGVQPLDDFFNTQVKSEGQEWLTNQTRSLQDNINKKVGDTISVIQGYSHEVENKLREKKIDVNDLRNIIDTK